MEPFFSHLDDRFLFGPLDSLSLVCPRSIFIVHGESANPLIIHFTKEFLSLSNISTLGTVLSSLQSRQVPPSYFGQK